MILQVHPDAYRSLRAVGEGRPGEFLAGRFRATWLRLPLGVRRELLAYWRTNLIGPEILISSFGMENMKGYCAQGGFILQFLPCMDLPYGPSDTENTIAHELAHAYRHATKQHEPWDVAQEEIETRRLAESWGFPQKPFNPKDYKKALALEADFRRALKAREAAAVAAETRPGE
jgi:hypothetical protein